MEFTSISLLTHNNLIMESSMESLKTNMSVCTNMEWYGILKYRQVYNLTGST